MILGKARLSLMVAWWDFWVGAYYDREKGWLYLFPVPCIGVRIKLNPSYNWRECESCGATPREGWFTMPEWGVGFCYTQLRYVCRACGCKGREAKRCGGSACQ